MQGVYDSMIYAALIVTAVLWAVTIIWALRSAAQERTVLLDRIMALSEPEALITHKAVSDPEPGTVSYVDEMAEAKAGNNYVELGDD